MTAGPPPPTSRGPPCPENPPTGVASQRPSPSPALIPTARPPSHHSTMSRLTLTSSQTDPAKVATSNAARGRAGWAARWGGASGVGVGVCQVLAAQLAGGLRLGEEFPRLGLGGLDGVRT